MTGMITLVTGGVKSGKSRRVLDLVLRDGPFPVSFIATAEVLDEEMRLRIQKHREERARLGGEGGFITIEEPLELDRAIAQAIAQAQGGASAVVDCLPMWINNLIYYKREDDFAPILEGFIRGLQSSRGNYFVVTNETGLGNIPFDEVTRHYNLLLAEANRKIAAVADRVEFMVSGIPLKVK